jgi:pyruvate,orthophosphate dikinase
MQILRISGASTEQRSAEAIGAKAANLAHMAALGLPVPPAFVLPVKLCADLNDNKAHAFDSGSAERLAAAGDPVILMRPDTSTADVAGFAVAAGIVTAVGARTAHAALVARQMGKPCVVGCGDLTIDMSADQAQLAGTSIPAGDWITIDGDSGRIYLGKLETVAVRPERELAEIASWRGEAGDHPRRRAATAQHGPAQH